MKIDLNENETFNGKTSYSVDVNENGFQMVKEIEVNADLTQSEVITIHVIPQFNNFKSRLKTSQVHPCAGSGLNTTHNPDKEEKELKLTDDEKWEWINVAQEKMKTQHLVHAAEIADKFIRELRKRL